MNFAAIEANAHVLSMRLNDLVHSILEHLDVAYQLSAKWR